jgi:hypothetical protein
MHISALSPYPYAVDHDRPLFSRHYSAIEFRFHQLCLTEVMKNGDFWDVTPRGSCNNRRFGGT